MGATVEHDIESLKQILRQAELFKLDDEQLNRLATVGEVKEFAQGDFVFELGDEGSALYVICEGEVRMSRTVQGMGEEAYAILKPGSVFGEMSVFDDSPRSADAIVHRPCKLFVASKDRFNTLLANNRFLASEVLWQLVRLLSNRLRQTNDKLTMLSVCSRFE